MPNKSTFLSLIIIIVALLSACRDSRGEDIAPVPDSAAIAVGTTVLPTATATAVMTFNINGGVGNFCDTLVIDLTGQYVLQSCQGEAMTGRLEQADLDTVRAWANNLTPFQLTTEAGPERADGLSAQLSFNGQGALEADEAQRSVIFEWINSLFIRLRPQPVAAPPTTAPPAIGPEGVCPDINRPAPLIADYDQPNILILIEANGQNRCDIPLNQAPFGRLVTAAGDIYYPVFDPEVKTVTIWRLRPDGGAAPLTFTSVSMEEFGPFGFIVSPDGRKIAWARTVVDRSVEPPRLYSDMWAANSDGSQQTTLLAQAEDRPGSFVEPARFSADQSRLYYAWQPASIDGSIFDFSGRYQNIYQMPLNGGPAELLFACSWPEQPLCLSDIAPDGQTLAYIEQGQIKIIDVAGQVISAITPPASDYVGPALFGPAGRLAFVSASLSQPATGGDFPRPSPGFISLVEPPYTAPPRLLLSDNSVATLWEWLDETRLMYGSIDEAGNIGTAVVTLEGQVSQLSPNYALAVLR